MEMFIAMVCGILAAHLVLLSRELNYRAREYFWLALRRHPVHVFLPMLFQIAVAAALAFSGVVAISHRLVGMAVGVILGGVIVAVPESVAGLLDRRIDERLVKKVSRALDVFIQTSRKNFREAVHLERKRDCLDYQHREGFWQCAVEPERERRHRLRMLYEKHKVQIAGWHRDSRLLWRDRYPAYQNFYPLVDYFGRQRLRDELCADRFESPREGWGGEEDRVGPQAENHPGRRCYDNAELVREIDEGRFDLDYRPRSRRRIKD